MTPKAEVMEDALFKKEVIAGLAELRTDMKRLVGLDGNGGVIEEFDGRISDLEHARSKVMGVSAALTALGSGVGWCIGHFIGKR